MFDHGTCYMLYVVCDVAVLCCMICIVLSAACYVLCCMQHTMRHNLYNIFPWLVRYGGTQNMRHNLYPLFWFVAPSAMQHAAHHAS